MIVGLAKEIEKNSIVDGEGLRIVVWAQGCLHDCKGCHNPETHDFNGGLKYELDEVKNQILAIKGHDGITFSGGDPLFQPEQFAELAKFAKSINLNVWCYTGFEFENLLKISKKNSHVKDLLENIDVLVDGKFKLEERSLNLWYKGSKNQRVLDVKKSLSLGFAYEIEKYQKEKEYETYKLKQKEEIGLFI